MYVCAFAHARVHVYVCAHACVYVDVECTQDQESSLSFVVYHSIILFSFLRILLRTQNLIKVEENRKEWGRTMASLLTDIQMLHMHVLLYGHTLLIPGFAEALGEWSVLTNEISRQARVLQKAFCLLLKLVKKENLYFPCVSVIY